MLRRSFGTMCLLAVVGGCQESSLGEAGYDAAPSSVQGGGSDAAVYQVVPDAGSGAGAITEADVPCEVKRVLDRACGLCHGATRDYGASITLQTIADFAAVAPKALTPVHQAAAERIQREGDGMMPPSGQPPLTPAERMILLDWLARGAPAGNACPGESSGSGGGVDGGVQPGPVVLPEGDCEISFELRASDGQGGKFQVPLEDDRYECFYFAADQVDPTTLATALSPMLDDTRVLHHWLLFAAEDESEAPSGTHRQCDGIHPGAYLMAAWLPGTPALVMPPDVGMEMPKSKSAQFILENHYNNVARYTDAADDSGVKVCATNKAKSQHAAIHWLGSERITLMPNATGSAQATCTPATREPIHILGVIPHLHQLGRHVTMTILRADGSSEPLHDGPFEFENQAYYAKQVVLQPGDRVHTKCDYFNDGSSVVTLGERTRDEMCYMFTLAYPVGGMNTGGDLLGWNGTPVVQGPNRCMR